MNALNASLAHSADLAAGAVLTAKRAMCPDNSDPLRVPPAVLGNMQFVCMVESTLPLPATARAASLGVTTMILQHPIAACAAQAPSPRGTTLCPAVHVRPILSPPVVALLFAALVLLEK